jgi:hypothetical protein
VPLEWGGHILDSFGVGLLRLTFDPFLTATITLFLLTLILLSTPNMIAT